MCQRWLKGDSGVPNSLPKVRGRTRKEIKPMTLAFRPAHPERLCPSGHIELAAKTLRPALAIKAVSVLDIMAAVWRSAAIGWSKWTLNFRVATSSFLRTAGGQAVDLPDAYRALIRTPNDKIAKPSMPFNLLISLVSATGFEPVTL
jgi:hypothetical protein